jgi:hypothetical protein
MSAGSIFQLGTAIGKFQGVVPRGDEADDAHRIAYRHTEFVGHLYGRGVAEKPPPLAAHVIGHVDGFLHIAARLGQDLAHFLCHEPREVFLAFLHNLCHAEENFATTGRGSQPPIFVRLFRSLHCCVYIIGAAFGGKRNDLFGGGVDRLERFAGTGIHPLAANKIAY